MGLKPRANASMIAICLCLTVFTFHNAGSSAYRSDKEFASALRLLQHRKIENRLKAVRILAGIDDPKTVEPLLSALNDGIEGVRSLAAETLGKKKDPRAVNALIQLALTDREIFVRVAAVKALGSIGEPSVEPLIKVLREQPEDKASNLSWSLVLVGTPAVGPLIRELENESPKIRKHSLYLLGELKDAGAVDIIIPILQDKDNEIAMAAADALGKLGDARAVEPLLFFFEYGDVKKAKAAKDALLKIGKPAAERLLSALRDRSSLTRSFAADLLGRMKESRALEPLLTLLDQETEGDVRNGAALALGHLGDPRAVEPLLGLLKKGSGNAGDAAAIEALGLIGDPRAIRWLMPFLNHNQRFIQDSAQNALSNMGKAAVVPLLEARRDPHSVMGLAPGGDPRRVVSMATCVLFRIGQPAADVLRSAGENTLAMLVGKELQPIAQKYGEIIELGIDCSESVLVEALWQFGGKVMAEHFLNCGNQELFEAARNWALKRGYALSPGRRGDGPVWKR